MNQKGNEPMTMLHARIPLDLMQSIDNAAAKAGISKSEYIRLALEYIKDNAVQLAHKVTYKTGI